MKPRKHGEGELRQSSDDRIAILSEDRPRVALRRPRDPIRRWGVRRHLPHEWRVPGQLRGRELPVQILVVEDQEQFDKAASTRRDLPELEWVVMDPKASTKTTRRS